MKLMMYLIGIFIISTYSVKAQDGYDQQRKRMVAQQIAPRGITNKATLKAMLKVERHKLVPPEMVKYAYEDGPLPIGMDQTISQPFIVAFMTQAIDLKPGMKVLEIGTGSGFQAAVLAEIVKEVYTIETVEPLARRARKNLEEMGYSNIHYKVGDGYFGWEEHAPFDAIIVTAAPEVVPPRLVEQLKLGGKMVIPVGPTQDMQYLKLLVKNKNGKLKTRNLLPVRFVPFTRNK